MFIAIPSQIHSRRTALALKAAFLTLALAVTACGPTQPNVRPTTAATDPDVLRIHGDGRMEMKGRPVPEKEVVIYPDGRGGERAAVIVRNPIHPDFYRDTIIVERLPGADAGDENPGAVSGP